MKNPGKILGIVFKVITAIAMICIVVISLSLAYIVFAPDDFPKPFRLAYQTTEVPTENPIPGSGKKATPTPEPTPIPYKPGDGIMFNMSTKIINLADSTSRKYIRLTMVLEFAPDDPAYYTMPAEEAKTFITEFEAKINKFMPIMDDTVITLLSTKKVEDLYTATGKEELRKELIESISHKVEEFELISVYFTEFVIQ